MDLTNLTESDVAAIAGVTAADADKKVAAMERAIVERIVDDALARGYRVSVFNGGEEAELTRSGDRPAILGAMFATCEESLRFYGQATETTQVGLGFVLLVYGNEGWDVISDHTDTPTMRRLLAGANALADRFAEEEG